MPVYNAFRRTEVNVYQNKRTNYCFFSRWAYNIIDICVALAHGCKHHAKNVRHASEFPKTYDSMSMSKPRITRAMHPT